MKQSPRISIIIPVHKRRDLITECLDSVNLINYPNYEVIVVDDKSGDGTVNYLRKKFPNVTVVENNINSGASRSRDNGAQKATGDFLFFLDSDTVVDRNILFEFMKTSSLYPRAGLIAPMIYYYCDKKRIWYAGAFIDMVTSQAKYRGIDQIDRGQFSEGLLPGGHAPTAALIKADVFKKSGGFSCPGSFYMGFEEPDIAKRIELQGHSIVFNPKAKLWHKITLPEHKSGLSSFLFYISFRNPKIGYSTSRNRVVFMKKYAQKFNYLLFRLFFLPLSLIIYWIKCRLTNQGEMWKNIRQGTKDGIKTASNIDR